MARVVGYIIIPVVEAVATPASPFYIAGMTITGILHLMGSDGSWLERLFMAGFAAAFWPIGLFMVSYSGVFHAIDTLLIWTALLSLAFMILYAAIHFIGNIFDIESKQYENFEEYATRDRQYKKQLLTHAFADQEAVFFKDGTSYTVADGIRTWSKNGVPHRKNGPALLWDDGTTEWFIDGVEVTETQAYLNR